MNEETIKELREAIELLKNSTHLTDTDKKQSALTTANVVVYLAPLLMSIEKQLGEINEQLQAKHYRRKNSQEE